MRNRWLFVVAALCFCAAPALADVAFVNGDFAAGDLRGWTVDAWNPSPPFHAVAGPGDVQYNETAGVSAKVNNPGVDAHVPIQKTWLGPAAQIGDDYRWGGAQYQYHQISQTAAVTGTSAGHLFFEWAAVIQRSGHGRTDTPFFQVLVLMNDTPIYNVAHYETDGGTWVGSTWMYTIGTGELPGWNVVDLDLDALGVNVGDSITLRALSRDCNPNGHAAYVYLDGFGFTPPPPPGVPEPGTMMLMGSGLVGLAGWGRKKFRK